MIKIEIYDNVRKYFVRSQGISMGALSCKKCKRFIGKLEWRMPFYESCLAFEI